MTFSRCPNYNGLPPQCQLVTDVNKPCCKKPYCNFQGVTIEVTNTPAPNMGTTIAPNPLNPTGPTLFPTPAPPGLPSLFLNLANMSVTSFLCFLPFSVTIDKTYNMLVFHLALSPLAVEFQNFAVMFLCYISEVCVYNGVQFKQGATWQDGCSLNCVCENGKTGFYRCNERYLFFIILTRMIKLCISSGFLFPKTCPSIDAQKFGG